MVRHHEGNQVNIHLLPENQEEIGAELVYLDGAVTDGLRQLTGLPDPLDVTPPWTFSLNNQPDKPSDMMSQEDGTASVRLIAASQRAAFRNFFIGEGRDYSKNLDNNELDGAKLVLLQWRSKDASSGEPSVNFQIGIVANLYHDNSGSLTSLKIVDPDGRPCLIPPNHPSIKGYGTLHQSAYTPQQAEAIPITDTVKQVLPIEHSSRAAVSNNNRGSHLPPKKAIAIAALASTSFGSLLSSSLPVAASDNPGHISSPQAKPEFSTLSTGGSNSSKTSSPEQPATVSTPTTPPSQSTEPILTFQPVILKSGDTIYGIAEQYSAATGQAVWPVVQEIENQSDNKALLTKDGGDRHLMPGQTLEAPVVPIPAAQPSQPTTEQTPTTPPSQSTEPILTFQPVILKSGDTIYGIAEQYSAATGQAVWPVVQEIENQSDNKALLTKDGGDRHLMPGQTLEAPVVPIPAAQPSQPTTEQTPTTPPSQSTEQSPISQQEAATQTFITSFQEKGLNYWAGGENATVQSGNIILYQDPITHEFMVGTVQSVDGIGADRVVITNVGNCLSTEIIEIGESPTIANQSISPTPSSTPSSSSTNGNTEQSLPPAPTITSLTPTPSATPTSITNGSMEQASPTTPSSTSSSNVESGLDCSDKCPPDQAMISAGDKFVFRYLAPAADGNKVITSSEANQDRNDGLYIGLYWENGAQDALGGYDAGVKAGQEALTEAQKLGVTTGTPFYFAADFNPTASQLPTIAEYIQGAQAALGTNYQAGAYGSYKVIKYLFDNNDIKWAVQTYAWSGDQLDPRAQFYQDSNGHILANGLVDYVKGMDGLSGLWAPSQQTTSTATPTATPAPTAITTPTPTPSTTAPTETTNGNAEITNTTLTPIATPAPTATPKPTPVATPTPTATPAPTPAPTATPTPAAATATPAPSESSIPANVKPLFDAIVSTSKGNNREILAKLMGSWFESRWQDADVGDHGNSAGPFQLDLPYHPGITVAEAENPNYAAQFMTSDYEDGISKVSPSLWTTNPEQAAEQTAYYAERPAETYYDSQGTAAVNQAYQASIKLMQAGGISTNFGS